MSPSRLNLWVTGRLAKNVGYTTRAFFSSLFQMTAAKMDQMNPPFKTILIVDDEADIRELLNYNLEQEGFRVLLAENGRKALLLVEKETVDLILLDLMIPEVSGLDVCKQLKRREDTEQIPIIMVTAKSAEADVIVGLELGADDYVTKPFSPREVVARVKAIFRRLEEKKSNVLIKELSFKGLEMDLSRYRVRIDGTEVKLTQTEFKILQCLLSRRDHVLTRDELVEFALGRNISVVDRTIDVHMTNLRKKIGPYGAQIESIRSVGYRFKET